MIVIYRILNMETMKAYIGQTTRGMKHRRYQHLREARDGFSRNSLHKDIAIFGVDKFSWEVLEECVDRDQLNERERFYIKLLNTLHPNGYNLDSGGKCGKGFSDESLELLREINLGDKNPMFGKPAWNKGLSPSEETRLKQSQARIALAQMPGYVHPSIGLKRTLEQIAKSAKGPRMRGPDWHKSHKNQFTDEVRAKMSARAKARSKPNAAKPVICIDTGVEYPSAREAARILNLAYQKISQCCLGNRKTHGKLSWKFKK